MKVSSVSPGLYGLAVAVSILGPGAVSASSEIQGAAILQHPCGKVSVKHMGLVNEGRMEEAVKLGTPELQSEWRAMPAADRDMMAGMMKAMSQSAADFSADIRAFGRLEVRGQSATLRVKKSRKDASGSSTEAMTQSFQLKGTNCAIAR